MPRSSRSSRKSCRRRANSAFCATPRAASPRGSRRSPMWRGLSVSRCRPWMSTVPRISRRPLARFRPAIDILASPMLANFQQELVRLSFEYKLPAICQFREMVEAGCLVSYGVRRPEMYAMLAVYADKMLKGAKAGETVAQQPAAVELVINRKTARELGIEIPPAVLARADEVIE